MWWQTERSDRVGCCNHQGGGGNGSRVPPVLSTGFLLLLSLSLYVPHSAKMLPTYNQKPLRTAGCSQSAVSFMLNPRHHTGGGRLERCPKVKPKHPDGLLVVGCSKGHEDVSFCLTSWVGLTPGPHFNSYKNIVHTTLVKKIRIKTLGQVWRTEWNMMFMCWQQITPETASGLRFGALGNLPENKWNSPSVHIFYNVLYQAAKCINYNITRTIYSLCPWWTYWQISCDLRSKRGSVYLVTHSHAVCL